MPPSVPRCRAIRPGTVGIDVVAVKRALSRAGYMQWGAFTRTWGPYAQQALQAFAKDKKYPGEVLGYGPAMHTLLVQARRKGYDDQWAFDQYSINLMAEQCRLLAETPEERNRKAAVAAARYWISVKDRIAYRQARPFALVLPPAYPAWWDCSAYVTACFHAGKAPDPNGRGYDGLGYTGTLINHGRRCSFSELKPGDLIFYGFSSRNTAAFSYGSPTHVAIYLGDGMVGSHGNSLGPSLYPYGYRRDINQMRTYPYAR